MLTHTTHGIFTPFQVFPVQKKEGEEEEVFLLTGVLIRDSSYPIEISGPLRTVHLLL